MEGKKYVCHISGQGEKWEVDEEHVNKCAYRVKGKMTHIHPDLHHYLPKSEYRECDPPEQWEDVTHLHEDTVHHLDMFLPVGARVVYNDGMHNGPHFIIERKKS